MLSSRGDYLISGYVIIKTSFYGIDKEVKYFSLIRVDMRFFHVIRCCIKEFGLYDRSQRIY